MATPRQLILRPIEIGSDNNTLTVTTSGSSVDIVAPSRVYANIFDLLKTMNDDNSDSPGLRISTSWRVTVADYAGAMGDSVTGLSSTALANLLGFTSAETASGGVVTATHAPAYCWASTNQSNTADRWLPDYDNAFHGSMAADGNLCGLSMSVRDFLTLRWQWETAANAIEQAATASFTGYGSVVVYPTKHSCFMSVLSGARTASLSRSTSGNVSPKGVYFMPFASDWLGDDPTVEWDEGLTWDSGGTNFDVATTANKDNFVFCSVPEAPVNPASQRELLSFYDVSVRLVTAVAPDWATS